MSLLSTRKFFKGFLKPLFLKLIETLTLTPIGYLSNSFKERYEAPRQPGVFKENELARIELLPNMNFEQALEDLAGFEKIWLIYWFHRNMTWKPKVLPPRSTGFKKRGFFATRSPHRPNPLGLSLVTLVSVEGRVLKVADTDLLDGTPILDIKPYLPYAEAFPDAKAGWLDEEIATEKNYEIAPSDLFKNQHAWLFTNFGIDLLKTISPVLKSNPEPHPYRRITQISGNLFEIAVKSWRVHFSVFKNVVTLHEIRSGYGIQEIVLAPENSLHDDKAHREFLKVWM